MARTGPTVPDPNSFDATLIRLRALIRGLEDSEDDGRSEQVLMDADLDGQRYLLIRMLASDRKQTPLSPREVEIARLVAEGHPNKVIAAVLEISSWTVCTHMRRVFAKLGVTSRAAMVARLSEFGVPMEVALAPSPARKPVVGEAAGHGPRPAAAGRPSTRNGGPLSRDRGQGEDGHKRVRVGESRAGFP